MKQNIMKKWIKALRSGKFKQGMGTLKQYNSKGEAQYCCLGVLCELYNQDMKKNKKKTLPEKVYDNDCAFSHGYCRLGGKMDDLPKEVMKWAGMDNSMGRFYANYYDNNILGGENSLAELNDTGRKFKTISNIIEKNWEVL
jgi:hypothetical protein